MLTNYFQKVRNHFLKCLFLILFLVPAQTNAALPVDLSAFQSETVDAASSNEMEGEAQVKEKKKDKVQLNQYFFLSLLINIVTVILIITLVYYPNYKKMDTIFTFLMFNIVIFLLTYVLNEVKMSMGAAFGLFAVFSMLRYRTAGIGIKDMTYLFIFIALGLVSAIQLEFYELGIIAAIIFTTVLLLDTKLLMRKEFSSTLRYEKIEMIKPDKRDALIKELIERTGLDIHRISINDIDFLKDTAIITYYYYEN